MSARTLVLLAALCVCGCSPGTSFLLDVDVSKLGRVEQLEVVGRAGERVVFGPAIRPDRPGSALTGHQTLRVLLPEDTAGKEVRVLVDALTAGHVVGHAQTSTAVQRGKEVKVTLVLEPGGSACGACDGCCEGDVCVSASLSACGAGGVACYACDPQGADNCSDHGRCQCGSAPACTALQGSNRCVDGECRCGNGPACGPGLECDNGVCRCTPSSCAGCCSANECLPGNTTNACGEGGAACTSCPSSNVCAAGACSAIR